VVTSLRQNELESRLLKVSRRPKVYHRSIFAPDQNRKAGRSNT
jgi:hypothetical protein